MAFSFCFGHVDRRPEDLSAWESFWLPARATQGEWLGIDLDAGAQWEPAARMQGTSWGAFEYF